MPNLVVNFTLARKARSSSLPNKSCTDQGLELSASRDNAWNIVSRRRHVVLNLFSANLRGDDLMFIGHVEMDFRNGKSVSGQFTGRLGVEYTASQKPKLTLYQVWAVSDQHMIYRPRKTY